jgi:hypothetical protein
MNINREDLDEVIAVLEYAWSGKVSELDSYNLFHDSTAKLRAMIEQPEPTDDWIECLPSEATMVRIGDKEFDYRPEETHPDLSGGVIDGCFFNERGFRSLKATFYRRKPVEPIEIEDEHADEPVDSSA